MRFEIELPEKYCDVISITAVGAKGTVIDLLARVITIQGHSGETLVIPENGDVRWETPIMFNKTMEQIVKKEEEQAKIDKAWENIKKLMGEEDFNEVKMIIKEAFKKASDTFNNLKKYCSNCGAELTNTEKKYYECFCEKCEKKLMKERDRLERNEAKRQAMVDAAYKHLEEITKKPLDFER